MEEYKRILIPTDGSEHSRLAVRKGVSLAKLVGGSVTALYVVNHSSFVGIPEDSLIVDVYSLLRKEADGVLSFIKDLGEEHDVPVETLVEEGIPSEEILRAAKDHDLIIMGTLGLSGLSKLLLGSTAEKVIRHAPCPVMVVRMSSKDEE